MNDTGEPFDPYYHWLGIPPEEQPSTHYRLLGIRPLEDNRQVIQHAADRQMAHVRTFQSGPHGAASQKILNELAAARVCLLTPEKKAEYDEQLRRTSAVPAPTVTPPPSQVEPPEVLEPPASLPPPSGLADVTSAQIPSSVRRRSRRRWSPLTMSLAALALTPVVVGLAVVAGILVKGSVSSDSLLVLNWPEDQRVGGTLEIDGQHIDLATATSSQQTVQVPLEPGVHQYRITRPNAAPLDGSFELAPEERFEIDLAWDPAKVKPNVPRGEIVLRWPETERAGRVLHVNGKVCTLDDENVRVVGDQIRVTVPKRVARVALLADGTTVLEKMVLPNSGKPVNLSTESTLELRWQQQNRAGFQLLVDGQLVDLAAPEVNVSEEAIELTVPAGKRSIEVRKQGDSARVTPQETMCVVGQRAVVRVDRMIARFISRVILRWPVEERAGATLEIDGKEHSLPANSESGSADYVLNLEPGSHTLRASRPGHSTIERTVDVQLGAVQLIQIDLKPIVSAMVSDEETARLREDFVKQYTQFREFRAWSDEADPDRKRTNLARLLRKLQAEARRMDRSSPEQYVALDQTYRMAVEQEDLATAADVLNDMLAYRCIDDDDSSQRREDLWKLAVQEVDLDYALAYFRSVRSSGKQLSVEEQEVLCRRIVQAPELVKDLRLAERTIAGFQTNGILDAGRCEQLRAAIYIKAGTRVSLEPPAVAELATKLLDTAELLLPRETSESIDRVEDLVDAAGSCRRKVLADRRSAARLRSQMEQVLLKIKEIEDQLTHQRRLLEARQAIAAGTATSSQHRMIGLWLLEKSKYDEAVTHLRQSKDASLLAIAIPLPQTAAELTRLADDIESESKKTKYPERSQLALLAYSQHVRQLALSKRAAGDDSVMHDTDPAERAWKSLPSERWLNLLDVVSFADLQRHAVAGATDGWKIDERGGGTIESTRGGHQKLTLPIQPDGSYAVRFTCRSSGPGDANVHLPLMDQSVVFTLGHHTGLQLVDQRRVRDSANIAAIDSSKFRFPRDTPVPIEIHVELTPVDAQSAKQRRRTRGADWVTISIIINDRPLGVVPLPAARFSTPPEYALPGGTLGFSTSTAATFSDIQVKRK